MLPWKYGNCKSLRKAKELYPPLRRTSEFGAPGTFKRPNGPMTDDGGKQNRKQSRNDLGNLETKLLTFAKFSNESKDCALAITAARSVATVFLHPKNRG